MGQLQNSVKAQYGLVDDPRTYLEKFISVTLRFDDQGEHPDESTVARYVAFLCKKMGLDMGKGEMGTAFTRIFPKLSQKRPLNLRTIQKIILHSVLITQTLRANTRSKIGLDDKIINLLIAVLCYLKIAFPEIYESIRSGSSTVSFADIKDAVDVRHDNMPLGKYISEFLEFYFNPKLNEEDVQDIEHRWGPKEKRLSRPTEVAREYVEALLYNPRS
jgi:hypothetical protein